MAVPGADFVHIIPEVPLMLVVPWRVPQDFFRGKGVSFVCPVCEK